VSDAAPPAAANPGQDGRLIGGFCEREKSDILTEAGARRRKVDGQIFPYSFSTSRVLTQWRSQTGKGYISKSAERLTAEQNAGAASSLGLDEIS